MKKLSQWCSKLQQFFKTKVKPARKQIVPALVKLATKLKLMQKKSQRWLRAQRRTLHQQFVMRSHRWRKFSMFLWPYLLLMVLLIVLPLIIIVIYSLIKTTGNILEFTLTFDHYASFFSNSDFVGVLFKSLLWAFIATILAVIIGYPVAYAMAFSKSATTSRNLIILVTLPIWTNMLIRMLGLRIIYKAFGADFYGSILSIILSMLYLFLPFVILPIYNSLMKIDRSLIEASQDLGANRWKTFYKITFRHSVPGILSGVTLMLLSAATSLIILWNSGAGTVLIGNLIENNFLKGSDFGFGAAVSIILAIVILIIIGILKLIGRSATIGKQKKGAIINEKDFKI